MPDRQVVDFTDIDPVAVQKIQNLSDFPGIGVFKRHHAACSVPVFHSGEHVFPRLIGARRLVWEQLLERNKGIGAFRPLIGHRPGGDQAPLVLFGNPHNVPQEVRIIGPVRLFFNPRQIPFYDRIFTRRVKDRKAVFKLIGNHFLHCAHPLLKQRRNPRVNIVDFHPCL